jgi:integrase
VAAVPTQKADADSGEYCNAAAGLSPRQFRKALAGSGHREVSRDRVLTDQELAAVILSARRMQPPYGLIVEFLALTGQRREEVAQLKWDELDEKTRTWTIPGSRTKNKKAHIVHLSTDFVGSPPCKLPPNRRELGIISVRRWRRMKRSGESHDYQSTSCGT